MGPDHFFCMMLGAAITLAVQWYARRKVAQAIAAPDMVARRGVELLDNENERRAQQIDRLQDRLQVLERITIDPATRTAREIEELRMLA